MFYIHAYVLYHISIILACMIIMDIIYIYTYNHSLYAFAENSAAKLLYHNTCKIANRIILASQSDTRTIIIIYQHSRQSNREFSTIISSIDYSWFKSFQLGEICQCTSKLLNLSCFINCTIISF